MTRFSPAAQVLSLGAIAAGTPLAAGCDQRPDTNVIVDNRFPASTASSPVIYRAYWQAVKFDASVEPGASSEIQSTVPASANLAYVILAPGWNAMSPTIPTSFLILQSRDGFAVHLDETLHIPVDDITFAGDCAIGSLLSQEQADFIVQRVFNEQLFAGDFPAFRYDAASCTTILIGASDGGP